MRAVGIVLLLLVAAAAFGQVRTATVIPAAPTTLTPVAIVVEAFDPCEPATFSRTGNTFRIDIPQSCVIVLPLTETLTFPAGLLPAGTYTYDIYVSNVFDRRDTFVVAEAGSPSVPALSPATLGLLAAAIAACSWICIARR